MGRKLLVLVFLNNFNFSNDFCGFETVRKILNSKETVANKLKWNPFIKQLYFITAFFNLSFSHKFRNYSWSIWLWLWHQKTFWIKFCM